MSCFTTSPSSQQAANLLNIGGSRSVKHRASLTDHAGTVPLWWSFRKRLSEAMPTNGHPLTATLSHGSPAGTVQADPAILRNPKSGLHEVIPAT